VEPVVEDVSPAEPVEAPVDEAPKKAKRPNRGASKAKTSKKTKKEEVSE
jgi:hypothetical protein